MWDLQCLLWHTGSSVWHANSQFQHVGSSSLIRDRTQAPYIGSTEFQSLYHQGSPCNLIFKVTVPHLAIAESGHSWSLYISCSARPCFTCILLAWTCLPCPQLVADLIPPASLLREIPSLWWLLIRAAMRVMPQLMVSLVTNGWVNLMSIPL